MDFKEVFEKIEAGNEDKVKGEIKKLVKGDGTFLKLKTLAKKSADNVPDFLDYVYKTYAKKIDAMSKRFKMKYDEMAQLFIAV